MVQNGTYEIEPAPIRFTPLAFAPATFWPPGLVRRLAEPVRQAATAVITAGSLVGIAMGFADASRQDDNLLQWVLHAVAVFTGLI